MLFARYRVGSKLGQKGVGKLIAHAKMIGGAGDQCTWTLVTQLFLSLLDSFGSELQLLFLCSSRMSNLEFL